MKYLILVFTFFFSVAVFGQTTPPNIDVGAPNGSSEVMLTSATDSVTGAIKLLLTAKSAYPHIGHYYSNDSGRTWSGSATVPSSSSQDPWVACDTHDSICYI